MLFKLESSSTFKNCRKMYVYTAHYNMCM